MDIREIDFRYDWLRSVLEALESGFTSVQKRAEAEEWFDGVWQQEHAENLLGIAFVAAQAYILGTTQDINRIRNRIHEATEKASEDKRTYYIDDLKPLSVGSGKLSRVWLINVIANYYKHHDEWVNWPTNETANTLALAGINKDTDFPCYEAATQLWGEADVSNLKNLLLIVSEWRTYVLSKYK